MSILKTLQLYTFLVLALNFSVTYAADCDLGNASGAPTPRSIVCVIGRVFNIAMLAGGLVFIGMIGYVAIKFAMSNGDWKGYEGAKTTFTYAVIGVFIVIGVLGIMSLIGKTFGITWLDPNALVNSLELGINRLLQIMCSKTNGEACVVQ